MTGDEKVNAGKSHRVTNAEPSLALPGLVCREHVFDVPLDHTAPSGERISVFAREMVSRKKQGDDLPWLVYFQGGPGYGSPRPMDDSGWLKRALADFRVLLLDQRGTGRSTPVTTQRLLDRGGAEQQAAYLKHFRQDSIVRDAELIRRKLCGDRPWTALGQSYGGWCITTYLSLAPQGLQAALFTGGLPPIRQTADDVYRRTFPIVEKKNRRFYSRYPGDERLVRELFDYLGRHEVRLPQGDRLTPERFQQLGLAFYRSTGYETLHYLLEEAMHESPRGREPSYVFLRGLENQFAFETNPIFAILHEACYAQRAATRWSAERVRREYPQFDGRANSRVLFTGEMIFPWMFEVYEQLRPLREAAHRLAECDDWPPLYDLGVLQRNRVPVAAIVYYEDMCVVREFSEQAAAAIAGSRVWITNEYEHDGVRVDGERILGRLLDMIHGDVQFAF